MARTEVLVEVEGPDPSDDVRILMRQPGTVALPLAKVASGGELARAMLALRLVLTAGPPTLVFDEVDAGIRSEEHTSELQSLMRISYAVFCLKKKTKKCTNTHETEET